MRQILIEWVHFRFLRRANRRKSVLGESSGHPFPGHELGRMLVHHVPDGSWQELYSEIRTPHP